MYDVFFIDVKEPNAEKNYELCKQKAPNVHRISGVQGIHQAHQQASKIALTEMMYVVDADAMLVPEFEFDYKVDKYNLDVVHVWHSRNPVNDLEYGYGGVKLFPTLLTRHMDLTTIDMSTSISDKFKVIEFLFDEEDWAIRLLGDKDDQEKMSEFFVELIPRKENNLKEEAKNFFTNLLNSTNQDLVGVAETLVSNLKKCSDSTISKIALLALSEWKNDFDLQAFNKETEKEGRKMPPRSEYVEVVERKSKIKIDGTKEVVVLSGVCSKITNKKSIGSIISDMEESRGKLKTK